MNITEEQLMAALTPLVIALHEKGALDLAELSQQYEDAVMRRKDLGATSEELSFQIGLATGFHRLAKAVKASEKSRPT